MRLSLSGTRSRLACAGLTAGAVAAALLVAPSAAYAVALDSLAPAAGPAGTVVTATKSAAFTGDGAGAIFTTASTCPSTYNTTSPNIAAGNPTKVNANSATFTVPTTLALNTGGTAKSYNVCVYVGSTVGTSASINDAPSTFLLTPGFTVSPTSGPSGGGNTVTATLPTSSAILPATPGVTFAAAGCPTTYGTTPVNPSTTVTRTSTTVLSAVVPSTVLGTGLTTPFSVCIYSGTATASTLIAASSAYSVTLPSVTLSSTIGPASTQSTGVNLTVTGATNLFTGITAPVAALVATPTACPALYPSSPGQNLTATLRKLANNKAALTVPTGATVVNSQPTGYNICVYSSTSTSTGRLLTTAVYTVANVPSVSAVLPNSGPALGNSLITVTGSNFPTTPNSITATLGGAALTSITPIDPNTFTAVTPAHSTGSVSLTVSTATGSDTLTNAYSYENSIQVSPNTAPNTSTVQDVDVQGTGFLNYTFNQAANTAAKVYLVDGIYNGITGTGNTLRQNGPVADCASVLVISDTELVCSLNLTAALNAAGAAVVSNGYHSGTATTTASNNIVTLATGTFTQADVGKVIAQTNNTDIPVNTTIVAVLSPTTAVMSANAVNTNNSAFAVTIGYNSGNVSATGTSGQNTLTGSALTFSQADVGRHVSGTGVDPDAVIVAVNDTGTTATLSVNNAGTVAGPVTLQSGNPVPNGAYNLTVVSNAATNAALNDNTYSQTVVSSGSTFTVAPF